MNFGSNENSIQWTFVQTNVSPNEHLPLDKTEIQNLQLDRPIKIQDNFHKKMKKQIGLE